MIKLSRVCVGVLTTVALLAGVSFADPIYMLNDANSTAQFDLGTQAGQFNWVVDQTPQLAQQWFWYRVGDLPEASFDTIGAPVVIQPIPSFLSATYTMPGSFTAPLSLFLSGGQLGSGTADIAETIRINNISGSPLDFHLFQYVNFDLNGTPQGDTVHFLAPNTVEQSEGSTILSETVITPSASHREAALSPQTLLALNDGAATTLNDFDGPLGPDDVTWAFQWDVTIATSGTLIVSKDKQIRIPEPMTLLLLVLGATAIARRSRR